jgi:hypothetical protein
MNRTFRNRICKESVDTIISTFDSFVCMLTDEQLKKWHDNCLTTIRALSNSVDKDTEQTQQFIKEETLKRDIIEDVCLRRRITIAYVR